MGGPDHGRPAEFSVSNENTQLTLVSIASLLLSQVGDAPNPGLETDLRQALE